MRGRLHGSLMAPYASALEFAKSLEDIPKLIAQFRRSPLRMSGDRYTRTSKLPFRGEQAPVYVSQQAITFVRSNGRVCFLSPAYSPVPLPADNELQPGNGAE